ncbi:hypothetical protein NA57DRAFT_70081 [Rhizodiscina lignyota]|uniref:F-box domain-containing protein n=1 Tax=Rhizodiscina lignyota TaxID=1504668 RepID=A0A9P4MDW6_9PEZI|nr:hypothetical protein NA57DRAFT_70081 [Rhizodiscina lignyota]
MSPPTLESLPAELLVEIVDFINEVSSFATLAATCKTFNRIATPFLYASYTNVRGNTTGRFLLSSRYSFKPFVRTVLERPDLAALCKEVDIRHWSTLSLIGSNVWEPEPISGEELVLFKKGAVAANILDSDIYIHENTDQDDSSSDEYINSDDMEFETSLKKGSEDALLIIMLAHLPRLETLMFRGMPEEAYKGLSWDRYLSRTTHNFKFLKTLVCGNVETEGEWELGQVSFFFRLPSFRYFVGRNINQPSRMKDWKCAPGNSAVTTICLPMCSMSLKALRTLIASCAALEHFEYARNLDIWDPNPLRASDVVGALLYWKDTLQRLTLTFTGRDAELLDPSNIGDVRLFSRITHLHVDWFQLRNSDVCKLLPESLVHLTVNDPDPRALSAFTSLAIYGRNSCPNLKRVEFSCDEEMNINRYGTSHFKTRAPYKELAAAFANAGIELGHFDSAQRRRNLFGISEPWQPHHSGEETDSYSGEEDLFDLELSAYDDYGYV